MTCGIHNTCHVTQLPHYPMAWMNTSPDGVSCHVSNEVRVTWQRVLVLAYGLDVEICFVRVGRTPGLGSNVHPARWAAGLGLMGHFADWLLCAA
ncbi:hypothetical protein LIER_40234 [Lithospermum erythrorhizon]|uniref:Uncharacterized protein n=1 Tax=Lithospermum erythrorhizon TaxID=34254 RepID=A0AAV3QVK5_LITER